MCYLYTKFKFYIQIQNDTFNYKYTIFQQDRRALEKAVINVKYTWLAKSDIIQPMSVKGANMLEFLIKTPSKGKIYLLLHKSAVYILNKEMKSLKYSVIK